MKTWFLLDLPEAEKRRLQPYYSPQTIAIFQTGDSRTGPKLPRRTGNCLTSGDTFNKSKSKLLRIL